VAGNPGNAPGRPRETRVVHERRRVFLVDLLPAGPALYPDGEITDEPEETLVAELIREAALEGVRDELPHSIAVVVEEMGLREGRPADRPLLDVHANLFIERSSQKPIVIGKQGAMIKRIGTEARVELESILGAKVFLDLHVSVHERWREDERFLGELEWPLG